MSLTNNKPSEKFVPSYQLSGKPYATTITGSTNAGGTQIRFPTVTRWVQVTNLGGTGEDVRIAFSAHGVDGTENDYFYRLEPSADGEGTTGRLELRCKSIFIKSISGTPIVTVVAGLTDIADMPTLSGSLGIG
jgi:hypothetical protein